MWAFCWTNAMFMGLLVLLLFLSLSSFHQSFHHHPSALSLSCLKVLKIKFKVPDYSKIIYQDACSEEDMYKLSFLLLLLLYGYEAVFCYLVVLL